MRDLLGYLMHGYVFVFLAAVCLGFVFSPIIVAIATGSWWAYLGLVVTLPVAFGALLWMDDH